MNDNTKAVLDGEMSHTDAIIQAIKLLRKRRHPVVLSYLDAHPGETGMGKVPSSLYDDGRGGVDRRLKAAAIWPHLDRLERKHALLAHAVFTGGGHNPADLWNGKGQKWAKRLLKRVLGNIDHYAVLEHGTETGIHVHIILPFKAWAQAEAGGGIFKGEYGGLVCDTWGMTKYLAKPADSRAALYDHKRQVVPTELADAATLYLSVRSKRFMDATEKKRVRGDTSSTSAGMPHTRWPSSRSANVSVTFRKQAQARRALERQNWEDMESEMLQHLQPSPGNHTPRPSPRLAMLTQRLTQPPSEVRSPTMRPRKDRRRLSRLLENRGTGTITFEDSDAEWRRAEP